MLTSAVGDASKLCLIVLCTVSGQVPCSGAERQGKGLDVVSTAIHADAVAMNGKLSGARSRTSTEAIGSLKLYIYYAHSISVISGSAESILSIAFTKRLKRGHYVVRMIML